MNKISSARPCFWRVSLIEEENYKNHFVVLLYRSLILNREPEKKKLFVCVFIRSKNQELVTSETCRLMQKKTEMIILLM